VKFSNVDMMRACMAESALVPPIAEGVLARRTC